ncbi:MAG: penicillin-binding protein [Oscillospiraceae bacterium]|nr:penicillin-binding protein [Oscillospiraceae bacterium]
MKNDKNITYVDLNNPKSAPVTPSGGKPQAKNGKPPQAQSKASGKLTAPQKTKSALAVVGTTFLSIFLIAVITVCIVAVALTVYVMQFAENSFDIDLKEAELSLTSAIRAYDPNEGEWVEVKRLHGDVMRFWVDIDDIPQHLVDAVVANEDNRFFEHEGVDWYATTGVMVHALMGGDVRGGSTITQQLVKNVTGDDRVSVGRKLREIFRAIGLEHKYTKIDILESYLNRVSFGGNSSGVGSAAWYYFDKDVGELTIAEAALMAAVLPSPHFYNPYNNPELARDRQEVALQQMYYYGFITSDEYDAALAEQIHFRRPIAGDYFGYVDERYNEYAGLLDEDQDDANLYYEDTPWDELRTDIPYKWNGDYEVTQNWYVDAAIWQVATHLAEQRGVSYERALDIIRSGGFTIDLNVDVAMQAKLEEKFLDPYTALSFYDQNAQRADLIQGAFVIMDYNGRILALVGGFGEKEGDDVFNRATQAVRSIGSTIKPISVYAPAIDMNIITYSTMQRDAAGYTPDENDPSKDVLWPANYNERPGGTMNYYPTWYAIQQSTNTIAVRTLQRIGINTAYTMMEDKLGFTTLVPSDRDWSPLALGALTEGARLHELTAAFAIFGNGGVYYEPYLYEKVVDHNGRIILEQNLTGTQAIEKDSSWVVNRMLKKVVDDPSGTGRYAQVPNIEVVGKTGTSNDMQNIVFAALTPEYVASYRFGFDHSRALRSAGADGWRSPARVCGDVLAYVSDTSIPKSFTPEPTVLERRYCRETGLLATPNCPSTEIGYYRASNLPNACTSAHDGTYWATHGDSARPRYD